MSGQWREIERPIQRAVATTDDENALVAERLHLAHRVEHRLAFVGLDAGDGRTLGLERSAAGGDDDDLGLEFLALIRAHAKQRIADLLYGLHHLAEMILRAEGLDLLQQIIDQPLRARMGNSGNVIDGLFRIKLRALAADLVENVDEMRLHIEQAEFEHREQANRPRADDHNVGLNRFSHMVSCSSLFDGRISMRWRVSSALAPAGEEDPGDNL